MFEGVKVRCSTPGSFKAALNAAGWLEDDIIAAGSLRQGKAARKEVGNVSQYENLQSMLPRRSKNLPRQFVLSVTADEVVAFKATELSPTNSSVNPYQRVKIREGVVCRYPRESVSLSDLPFGAQSRGGTMTIDGESFPVVRPNSFGDPNTNELLAVLGPPTYA